MGYVRVGVRKKPRRLATEIAVFLLAVTAIGLVVGGGGTHDLPATLAGSSHGEALAGPNHQPQVGGPKMKRLSDSVVACRPSA